MTKGEALRNRMVEVYDMLRELGLDDVNGEMRATATQAHFDLDFYKMTIDQVKKLDGMSTLSVHGSEPFMCSVNTDYSKNSASLKVWRRVAVGEKPDTTSSGAKAVSLALSKNYIQIDSWLVRSTNFKVEEE